MKFLCLSHLILCTNHKPITSIVPSIKGNISLSTYILIHCVRDTLYFRINYYQIKILSNFTGLCYPARFPVKLILWKKYISDRSYYEKGRKKEHHINILHIKCSCYYCEKFMFPHYHCSSSQTL